MDRLPRMLLTSLLLVMSNADGAMCCLAPKLETPEARGVASLDFRKETRNHPELKRAILGAQRHVNAQESLPRVYPACLL